MSANIGGVITPVGMSARGNGAPCSGNMYKVRKKDKKDPRGKGRGIGKGKGLGPLGAGRGGMRRYEDIGMIPIGDSGHLHEEVLSEKKWKTTPVGKGKWKLNGKVGVWRTIRGNRYFFPDKGSPTPPIRGSKKGLLSRVLGAVKKAVSGKKAASTITAKGKKPSKKKTKELAKNIGAMIKKAGGDKKNKGLVKTLKKMDQALKSGDEKGFAKAQRELGRHTKKLKKRKGIK